MDFHLGDKPYNLIRLATNLENNENGDNLFDTGYQILFSALRTFVMDHAENADQKLAET